MGPKLVSSIGNTIICFRLSRVISGWPVNSFRVATYFNGKRCPSGARKRSSSMDFCDDLSHREAWADRSHKLVRVLESTPMKKYS
jgi:hypothetical protein